MLSRLWSTLSGFTHLCCVLGSWMARGVFSGRCIDCDTNGKNWVIYLEWISHHRSCYSERSLFLSSELGEIPTLKTLQVFGIVPDGTLQLLKEALPHLQINSAHFTTIARPTTGNKKNQEIWGIRCRLTLQKPSCLWSIYGRVVSPLFFGTGKMGKKPACWSARLFLFLVFPLPAFYKCIRQPIESENDEVLLFLNNQKSFGHCFCALTSPSLRPF